MNDRLLKLKDEVLGTINARLKVPKERLMSFLNLRPDRERKMIILLIVSILLGLDYLVLIKPVISVFAVKLPELAKAQAEYKGLVQDKKNEALISSSWEFMKGRR